MTATEPPPATLHERFMRFHSENPDVYRLFRHFAHEARRAGMRRYSAKAIMERLRWELSIAVKKDGEYKINNDYVARYARMLAQDEPKAFADFFEFRALKRS